jgi:hypothetical protein
VVKNPRVPKISPFGDYFSSFSSGLKIGFKNWVF